MGVESPSSVTEVRRSSERLPAIPSPDPSADSNAEKRGQH
jgi:hypothetical protein